MTPGLPRPLDIGEFFCHRCQEFVKWVEREAHQKLHQVKARLAS
jgi:hypothetical protein